MKKLVKALVPMSTVTAVALTLVLGFASLGMAASDTRYAAGNETAGTNICNCPVEVGDCVCAYTPKQVEPSDTIDTSN